MPATAALGGLVVGAVFPEHAGPTDPSRAIWPTVFRLSLSALHTPLPADMKNIYVANLPYSSGDDDLRTLFEEYGAVDKATIIKDRDTGRSRGFGFVEMSNDSEADAAIEGLNGRDMSGRPLTVNEARPRTERSGGGGGGGGGYRGGGGGGGYRGGGGGGGYRGGGGGGY